LNYNNFLEKFRRKTTSGDYYPEVDGLRFIAIITVLLFHISLSVKTTGQPAIIGLNILELIFNNGWQGVELFFAISGFIIGLPYAKQYINGGRPVVIKTYLLRRVTRLEPPYFVALILFLIVQLAMNQTEIYNGLLSLFQSMFYFNFLINNNLDYLIISVIWSLEIEVQFYLLAILLSKVFKLKLFIRRTVLVLSILIFPILQIYVVSLPTTIFNFIQFFLIGFLLADLFLDSRKYESSNKITVFLGFVALGVILLVDHRMNIFYQYLYLVSMFLFYFIVMNNDFWKKMMSLRLISVIGGMCYTIYLIHSPIVSAYSRISSYLAISDYYLVNWIIASFVITPLVLLASAVFFRYVEQPCMDKNWFKNLLEKFNPKTK